MIHKSYYFRIYPNSSQRELFAKHFGCDRFVYNHFLNLRKTFYEENKELIEKEKSLPFKDKTIKFPNFFESCKELVKLKTQPEYVWLNEVNSQSLLHSLKCLDSAYQRFFKKKSGYPVFKNKYSKQSFNAPQHMRVDETCSRAKKDLACGKVFLPKFKEGIKVKIHQPILGTIKNCTVSKTSTNKYYVSIVTEQENTMTLPTNGRAVGIDLGLRNYVTTAHLSGELSEENPMVDGVKLENPRTLEKYSKKLAFLQRRLSKKKVKSIRRLNAKKKVALVHEKIVCLRKDFLHKLSNTLTNENQVIIIEDLNIEGMKKSNLAKSVCDASWSTLVRQLAYKSCWKGRELIKVNRFFPSTKTCNSCKSVEAVGRGVESWTCPHCGQVNDRDMNAAKNILEEGLRLREVGTNAVRLDHCEDGIVLQDKQKHGESLTLVGAVNREATPFRVG